MNTELGSYKVLQVISGASLLAIVAFGGFSAGMRSGTRQALTVPLVQQPLSAALLQATTTAALPAVATTSTTSAPVAKPKVVAKTVTKAAAPAAAPTPSTFTNTSGAWQGKLIAGAYSPFLEFVRADYDRAVREGKLVLLFFYDAEQGDTIEYIRVTNAFAKRQEGGVVGFRVDFGPTADAADREIAGYFNVETTNTKVIVRNNIILIKSADVWNEARIAKELNDQW
jgi:hypothetical protein